MEHGRVEDKLARLEQMVAGAPLEAMTNIMTLQNAGYLSLLTRHMLEPGFQAYLLEV